MTPLLATTKDDFKEKPAILKFYDFSKGGTDIIDQRIGFYTCNTKSLRWSLSGFSYILDTMRVNAQTIYALNKGVSPRKVKSFEFGWEIVKSLVIPHVEIRKIQRVLPTGTVGKINMMLGVHHSVSPEVEDPYPARADKPGRCTVCIEKIRGDGYTSKRSAISRINNQCQRCGIITCKKHLTQLCPTCSKKK
jgi:hypothetical protein